MYKINAVILLLESEQEEPENHEDFAGGWGITIAQDLLRQIRDDLRASARAADDTTAAEGVRFQILRNSVRVGQLGTPQARAVLLEQIDELADVLGVPIVKHQTGGAQ